MRVEIVYQRPPEPQLPEMEAHHADPVTGEDEMAGGGTTGLGSPGAAGAAAGVGMIAAANRDPTDPNTWGKVGRNEPCPCGSGKKFKHCHGVLA